MSSCFTRASCWALILCVFYWVLVIIHVVKASPSSSSVAPPNSSIPENRSVGLTTQSNTTAIMNDDQRHAFLKRCLESNLYFYPLRSSLNSSTHNSEAECCFRLARNHLYNQVIEDFEKISPNKTKLHYPASFTQISSSLKTCHGIIDTNDSHQKQWIQGNFSQLFQSMSTSQLWNIASAEAVNVQEGMGNFPIETYLACDGNFTCISNAIKLCASHIVFTHILKVRHNETNRDIGKEIIGAYYNQVIESWGIQSTENRDGKMNIQTLAQLLWHSCSEPGTKELVLLSPKQVPFVFAPILFIGIVTLLLIQQCNFSDHPVEMTSDICENLDPTTTMDVPGSTTSDHSSTSQATDKDPASTDNQDLANNDTTHSETNKQECKTSVSDETSTTKKPAGEIQPTSSCHQSATSSSVDPQTPTESSLKQESNVQSNILVSDETNTEKSSEEIQQTNTSAPQSAISQKDTQESSFKQLNENDHNSSQTTDLNNSIPSLSTSSSQQTELYGEVSMESHQEVKSEKTDKEMEDVSPLDGSSTDLQGKEQEETSTRTTCETCLNTDVEVLEKSTHNTECEKAENNTLSETPISPHSTNPATTPENHSGEETVACSDCSSDLQGREEQKSEILEFTETETQDDNSPMANEETTTQALVNNQLETETTNESISETSVNNMEGNEEVVPTTTKDDVMQHLQSVEVSEHGDDHVLPTMTENTESKDSATIEHDDEQPTPSQEDAPPLNKVNETDQVVPSVIEKSAAEPTKASEEHSETIGLDTVPPLDEKITLSEEQLVESSSNTAQDLPDSNRIPTSPSNEMTDDLTGELTSVKNVVPESVSTVNELNNNPKQEQPQLESYGLQTSLDANSTEPMDEKVQNIEEDSEPSMHMVCAETNNDATLQATEEVSKSNDDFNSSSPPVKQEDITSEQTLNSSIDEETNEITTERYDDKLHNEEAPMKNTNQNELNTVNDSVQTCDLNETDCANDTSQDPGCDSKNPTERTCTPEMKEWTENKALILDDLFRQENNENFIHHERDAISDDYFLMNQQQVHEKGTPTTPTRKQSIDQEASNRTQLITSVDETTQKENSTVSSPKATLNKAGKGQGSVPSSTSKSSKSQGKKEETTTFEKLSNTPPSKSKNKPQKKRLSIPLDSSVLAQDGKEGVKHCIGSNVQRTK